MKYRGKYPKRICFVSTKGPQLTVMTNDSSVFKFTIDELLPGVRLPKVREEIADWLEKWSAK